MVRPSLLERISTREVDKDRIANEVINSPDLLSELLDGLDSKKPRIRFGCAKVLRFISDKEPALLYPHLDFFVHLLDSDNKVFQWEAIYLIANLACVDARRMIAKIFDRYFEAIPGPVMITAANIVGGAARIALAQPELSQRITEELLKVEQGNYQTAECRNVVLGHAIQAFDAYYAQVEDKGTVVSFVKRQLKNSRNATRVKAEKFLNKYQIPV